MKATPLTLSFPQCVTITPNEISKGAIFLWNRQARVQLWRIWDFKKPQVLFIGLNPSIADDNKDDPTIKRVIGFAKSWGYGGIYMMNCFAHVSTNSKHCNFGYGHNMNCYYLKEMIGNNVGEVIFAWGNHDEVKRFGMDVFLKDLFPQAKALGFNKNGSPKHPLFVKADTVPVPFTDKNRP